MNAAARANQHKIDTGSFGCINTAPAAYIAVRPTLFSRNSLSVADAKRIYPSDKANAFYEEAKRVVETGVYRIWS